MSVTTTYRTCPRSGLQFENQAEWLMKANAFVGVVWLLIGGILAIGVVLTRWPAIHWLEADTFYMVLTAHGIDMLIFWIIFFEVAVLYFCASTLLRCRIATPKIAWLAFALMVIGAVRQQHRRLPRCVERHDDLLRADDGRAELLPRPDPVRRRRADRLLRVLRHPGRGQGREDLRGLGAAGHLRCHHRRHHRGVHDQLRRDHPDPDLADVDRRHRVRRPAGLPHDLVGLRPQLAADQRRRPHLGVVPGGGDRLRRQADERACQPHAPSCSTSCSCSWPARTTCSPTRGCRPAGRSSTPATSCTSRCWRR